MVVHFQVFFKFKKHDVNGTVYCYFDLDKVPASYPHIYAIIDSVMYSFLASAIILVCNIAIIIRLVMAKLGSSHHQSDNTLSKIAVTTSIMLVSVSGMFLALTIPACTIWIMFEVGESVCDSLAATPHGGLKSMSH